MERCESQSACMPYALPPFLPPSLPPSLRCKPTTPNIAGGNAASRCSQSSTGCCGVASTPPLPCTFTKKMARWYVLPPSLPPPLPPSLPAFRQTEAVRRERHLAPASQHQRHGPFVFGDLWWNQIKEGGRGGGWEGGREGQTICTVHPLGPLEGLDRGGR